MVENRVSQQLHGPIFSLTQIRRPAGVSCGSCLFVVVLFVLSLYLSRLSLWCGFSASSNWRNSSASSFRLHFSCLTLCWAQICPTSLNTGLVLNILLSFPWLCPPFLLCLPLVCSVFSYIQYLIHCFLCQIHLHAYVFYIWPLPRPSFTHMFWFKPKPCLEQKPCCCAKPVFYTKGCFTQKSCYTQTQCFMTKTIFLLDLFKPSFLLAG